MPKVSSGERTGTFQELRESVQIDKNMLDDNLVEQPDLFYRVSEEYSLAKSLQDEIKYEISQLEAELGAQFRDEAERAKDKLTVDALKQMIAGSPKMADLQREFVGAQKSVGKWSSLKEAYDMRSSALKSLTQLFASNYFTVQTGSRPRQEAQGRAADEVRQAAGEARQREPRLRPRKPDAE